MPINVPFTHGPTTDKNTMAPKSLVFELYLNEFCFVFFEGFEKYVCSKFFSIDVLLICVLIEGPLIMYLVNQN